MKKYLLLPLLAFAAPVAAQHMELQARAGASLFRFGGADAQASSVFNYREMPPGGYTNSPYGSLWGAGVVAGARAVRVGKRQGLLAIDLGYDGLQSRTNVTGVWGPKNNYGYDYELYHTDGSTALQIQSLTGFLGGGHRFAAGKLNVDALAGPELTYIGRLHEKGSGTFGYNGGTEWNADFNRRPATRLDARLRADATVWYQRLGFNASYSHGFVNYQSNLVGASLETYARVLRLGLIYRLR